MFAFTYRHGGKYVRDRYVIPVLRFLSEILSRHTSGESAVDVAAIHKRQQPSSLP